MPVNREVVRRKLLSIEQAVQRLESWLPITAAGLEHDVQLQWAVERGLQVAAEALFDVGSHILASEFREVVDEYREIAPRLASRQVIRVETSERLDGLAGFRNLLVHDYADIDLELVARGLERLDDFEQFVTEVSAWLDRLERGQV